MESIDYTNFDDKFENKEGLTREYPYFSIKELDKPKPDSDSDDSDTVELIPVVIIKAKSPEDAEAQYAERFKKTPAENGLVRGTEIAPSTE
jgi:hypothetical protein